MKLLEEVRLLSKIAKERKPILCASVEAEPLRTIVIIENSLRKAASQGDWCYRYETARYTDDVDKIAEAVKAYFEGEGFRVKVTLDKLRYPKPTENDKDLQGRPLRHRTPITVDVNWEG